MPAGTLQSGSSPSPSQPQPIPFWKFAQLKRDLDELILGFDTGKLASILGLVTGLPVLFLGSPGSAKTATVRLLAEKLGITGKDYFYALMNPYTREEELFGAIDVKKLTEQGILERNVNGYMPTAKVIFLDEIFKAPGELRTTLFNIMNEKTVRFGSQFIRTPWLAFFGASNEVEVRDTTDIAFLDRFKIISFMTSPSYRDVASLVIDTPSMQAEVAVSSAELKAMSIGIVDAEKDPEEEKLSEDDVRRTQAYVILLYKNNVRAQKNLLRDFFAKLAEVVPKLDFGAYRLFYENLDKNIYISLRRSAEMVHIAYALAYLLGDQQVDFIHLGVASIFVIPIAYQVYLSYVVSIKGELLKWLNEYVDRAISGVSKKKNNDEKSILDLYNEAREQKLLADSIVSFINVLERKLGDEQFADKLARTVAEKYIVGEVKHPLVSLSELIAGFMQALVNGTSMAENVRKVLEVMAKRNNKKIEDHERECRSMGFKEPKELEECIYDTELGTLENMLFALQKLNAENIDEVSKFQDVNGIIQTLNNSPNVKTEYDAGKLLDALMTINTLSDVKQKLIELKQSVATVAQNASVDDTFEKKRDAINEFLIKPLMWVYGFDVVDKQTFDEIKKIQERLDALIPTKINEKAVEIINMIDETIKTIDDITNKIDNNELNVIDYAVSYTNLLLKYRNDLIRSK